MTIVPAATTLSEEYSQAVPLALYAQVIGYDEYAFWGVAQTDANGVGCHDPCFSILRKWERDKIRRYLREAQTEIEQITQFPLAPRYVTDTNLPWRDVLRSSWMLAIEPGVMATDDLGAAAVVDVSADPLVYRLADPGIIDVDELHIYHPNTEAEISPSSIEIADGLIVISVPRCRAIRDENNPAAGWDYNDDLLFEATIDVVRIYTDASEQATIYCVPGCTECESSTKTGCIHIKNYSLGVMVVSPATYNEGEWTAGCLSCCCPESVTLNYRAGMNPTTKQAVDAVIRLAHAKAPTAWCSCSYVDQVWRRDRETPEVLTAERLNNPFGYSNGALVAFAFANAMRKIRGATL